MGYYSDSNRSVIPLHMHNQYAKDLLLHHRKSSLKRRICALSNRNHWYRLKRNVLLYPTWIKHSFYRKPILILAVLKKSLLQCPSIYFFLKYCTLWVNKCSCFYIFNIASQFRRERIRDLFFIICKVIAPLILIA